MRITKDANLSDVSVGVLMVLLVVVVVVICCMPLVVQQC